MNCGHTRFTLMANGWSEGTFDRNRHTVPTYRPQELPHGPPIARLLSLGLWPDC